MAKRRYKKVDRTGPRFERQMLPGLAPESGTRIVVKVDGTLKRTFAGKTRVMRFDDCEISIAGEGWLPVGQVVRQDKK